MDSYSLKGKAALVTGSGRGLGFAIAQRLAELGADVAIHDRSQEAPAEFGEHESLDAAALLLASYGVRAVGVLGDVTDEAETARFAADAAEALGPIDILVNCAGGDIAARGGKPVPNDALGVPMEDVRAIMERNFIATMLVSRAIVPGMIERQRGSVINIASVAAHAGITDGVAYACAKAAIVHYTRCLAAETRAHGVRVNCVSPGATKTSRFLATRVTDPERMEEGVSMQRYGSPAEVASAIAYLACDAAGFVHGQVIRVDGGQMLWPG